MGSLSNITRAIANKDQAVRRASEALSETEARLRKSLGIPDGASIEEAASEADPELQMPFREYFAQKRRLGEQRQKLSRLLRQRESLRGALPGKKRPGRRRFK